MIKSIQIRLFRKNAKVPLPCAGREFVAFVSFVHGDVGFELIFSMAALAAWRTLRFRFPAFCKSVTVSRASLPISPNTTDLDIPYSLAINELNVQTFIAIYPNTDASHLFP